MRIMRQVARIPSEVILGIGAFDCSHDCRMQARTHARTPARRRPTLARFRITR